MITLDLEMRTLWSRRTRLETHHMATERQNRMEPWSLRLLVGNFAHVVAWITVSSPVCWERQLSLGLFCSSTSCWVYQVCKALTTFLPGPLLRVVYAASNFERSGKNCPKQKVLLTICCKKYTFFKLNCDTNPLHIIHWGPSCCSCISWGQWKPRQI